MREITVAIGQYSHRSQDGGATWVKSFRDGTSFAPVHVGLLQSTDGGTHWRHVHVFDGPDLGDVNERHMLTLDVR